MSKPRNRYISFGTIVMLCVTAFVVAGFVLLMPSFTGNQDILIDAARIAVAVDDSINQLTLLSDETIPQAELPQSTYIPPFTSQTELTTPPPAPTAPPKYSFSLCAAGSVELNNDVRKALTFDRTVRYDLLTDQVVQALEADLSIATLRNTVSSSHPLSNVNMDAGLLDALRAAGINTLSIAHPNMLDFGEQGLNETDEAVRLADMLPHGGTQHTTINVNGVNIALLHYQDKISSTGRDQTSEAFRGQLLHPLDVSIVQQDIEAARSAGAQIVIITLWWGADRQDTPSGEQVRMAQAIADAGADIILGTGNGALQPVQVLTAQRGDQKYHPVLCAYSLGNLFSPDRESRITLASLLLKTTVIYDTATDTVAFEDLNYTPTYAWRGKDDGRTLQRILINDPSSLPSFVDKNQKGVMDRCMTLVTSLMADTAIPMNQ